MRVFGGLFAIVLAVSLVLIPAAPASAAEGYGGLANCEWDTVKWQDNENSWHLYLQHWGRTPVTAMSRLAGLCGPNVMCGDSFGLDCPTDPNTCTMGGCAHCRVTEEGFLAGCSDPLGCADSLSDVACSALAMAEGDCPEGTLYGCAKCCCCWGISLAFANKSWAACDISDHPRVNNDHPNHYGSINNYGGDWGVSGCAHTECVAQTWCLTDNLCPTCTP